MSYTIVCIHWSNWLARLGLTLCKSKSISDENSLLASVIDGWMPLKIKSFLTVLSSKWALLLTWRIVSEVCLWDNLRALGMFHSVGCQCLLVPSIALQMDTVGKDADKFLLCCVSIIHSCRSPSAYSSFSESYCDLWVLNVWTGSCWCFSITDGMDLGNLQQRQLLLVTIHANTCAQQINEQSSLQLLGTPLEVGTWNKAR